MLIPPADPPSPRRQADRRDSAATLPLRAEVRGRASSSEHQREVYGRSRRHSPEKGALAERPRDIRGDRTWTVTDAGRDEIARS